MSERNLRKRLEALSPVKLRMLEKFVAYLERKPFSKPKSSAAFKRRLARKIADQNPAHWVELKPVSTR
jgi:hypothetical protein